MLEVLKYLEYVEDKRQPGKIKHKASDCIAITLFATLANANEWTEIQAFAEATKTFCVSIWNCQTGFRRTIHLDESWRW